MKRYSNMFRVILVLSIAAIVSSCATDPVPVEESIVNVDSFVWVPGNSITWESTSVNPERKSLDTVVTELMRKSQNADTTIEEWTNRATIGYWGRTIASQFETASSAWMVQCFYPTTRGEIWNRSDSSVITNESGDSISVMYMRIRTETADTVITTPAGAFRCAKYIQEMVTREGVLTGIGFQERLWYAPRVGIIQWESWYTPSNSKIPEQTHLSRVIRITR